MTRSTGQPSRRLFSGSVLFFVITVQVAPVSSRSTKWPYPQLEREREPSDDAEAHFAFTKWMITHPGRCQVPLLLLLLPPMKNRTVPGPATLKLHFYIKLFSQLCRADTRSHCLDYINRQHFLENEWSATFIQHFGVAGWWVHEVQDCDSGDQSLHPESRLWWGSGDRSMHTITLCLMINYCGYFLYQTRPQSLILWKVW